MTMKHLFLIPIVLVLAACSSPEATRIELTNWQFSWHNQDYEATVPGFIHTDLMTHGVIPDPYYGTNEESVRWVGECQWHYFINIDHSRLPKADTLWIVFEGLAGHAEIHGLGDTIYHVDNMFIGSTFFFPDTCSRVDIFFTPLQDSLLEASYGIPLPDRRAFTRIAPYQQGWDWGTNIPTCGIWKPVYISSENPEYLSPSAKESEANNNSGITFLQQSDSIGQCFAFFKDGKRLFAKGANWIPQHAFPVLDDAAKARYRYLLCSAKEANFNMIRVWGGGIYEHDYFFELCDSLGLMVWVDFNFSTMLYPDNDEMLQSIDQEARENVARIARHPCVVLWCGNNEVKNGWEDWGWQNVYNWSDAQRRRLTHAIDTIFGYPGPYGNTSSTSILARAVADCDPLHRPYITTSPLFGWGHPECTTHGDSHYWGVWWGEEPFEKYNEKTGRFMSEYGFQSYPLFSSIKQFCPAEQLTIDSPTLRNHQKHGRGREIIDKAMKQYYGVDSRTLSLEDFAYVSQLLQAWGIGYAILCHLSNPRCDGTLYWQLNDSWPVASWSSIDFFGNWKALHYRVKELYSDTVDLQKWQKYYAQYPKDRTYQAPRYDISKRYADNTLEVTLTAKSDIYDLLVETVPHCNGHFNQNFVDLKAGQTVTLRFQPAPGSSVGPNTDIAVRTLNEIFLP